MPVGYNPWCMVISTLPSMPLATLYHPPRQTDPSAFEKPATTVLSPYLKFGCLSTRLFHTQLLQVRQCNHRFIVLPLTGNIVPITR